MALEIAHQLEALGGVVALLALLDTEPRKSPAPSRVRREATQLRSLVRGSDSAVSYVERRAKNLLLKAQRAPWLVDHWLHRRTGRPLHPRWDNVARVESLRVAPVRRSLQQALASYSSPPTRCAVTYFRAGEPTAPEGALHVRDRED